MIMRSAACERIASVKQLTLSKRSVKTLLVPASIQAGREALNFTKCVSYLRALAGHGVTLF